MGSFQTKAVVDRTITCKTSDQNCDQTSQISANFGHNSQKLINYLVVEPEMWNQRVLSTDSSKLTPESQTTQSDTDLKRNVSGILSNGLSSEVSSLSSSLAKLRLEVKEKEPANTKSVAINSLPLNQERLLSRQITSKQINKVGEPSKADRSSTVSKIQQINRLDVSDGQPENVRLRYESGYQYRRKFKSLIRLEADFQKTLKDNVDVRWQEGLNDGFLTAFFKLPKSEADKQKTLKYGDDIQLTHLGLKWSGFGYVVQIPKDAKGEVGVNIRGNKSNAPINCTTNFIVEYVWESVSFERMQFALQKFAHNESVRGSPLVSNYIRQKLLGHEIKEIVTNWSLPEKLSAPNLKELNSSQEIAVQCSLQNALSLIQGPPGTGKTETSATIVYHMKRMSNHPVLVCAQSNIAVDQLTEKIDKTGLRVVRIYAVSKEEVGSPVSFLGLHNLVFKRDLELQRLKELKDRGEELSKSDEKKYLMRKRESESEILSRADVICCTCIGAADKRLKLLKFYSVLIDESMQATEPECLVPIMLGAQQLVLVGDQKQLGPVITCKKAAKAGLEQSLFDRLVALGNCPLRLTTQYRMHPSLSLFPSNVFYEGSLKDGVSADDRKMKMFFRWPQPNKPMFFFCSEGQEQRDDSDSSYINKKEAVFVENIVCRCLKFGIKPKNIGVITPYKGQCTYLVDYMKRNRSYRSKLEVASVNGFQGREKDLIIFSCVRSNKQQKIGFLKDPRRLNVALTRARHGLIIVGNPKVLSTNPLWNDLMIFYKEQRVLMEGRPRNLNNLSQTKLTFTKTSKSDLYS